MENTGVAADVVRKGQEGDLRLLLWPSLKGVGWVTEAITVWASVSSEFSANGGLGREEHFPTRGLMSL